MDNWYILYASHPLDASRNLERLKELYLKDEQNARLGNPFLQLRVPNEYVDTKPGTEKLYSKEAHAYLFKYIFVKANLASLDAFLRYRQNGNPGVRLLMRSTIEKQLVGEETGDEYTQLVPTAATISNEDVTRFFTFCEAYARFHQHKKIPFRQFTPQMARMGDRMEVIQGPYKGQLVMVQDNDGTHITQITNSRGKEETVPAMVVNMMWLNNSLCVPVTIPCCYLQLKTPKQYIDNKYAYLDEFFDYVGHSIVQDRIASHQPSPADCVKALRIQQLAHYEEKPSNHRQRASLRLQVLNLCALALSHHILGNRLQAYHYLQVWNNLYPTITNPTRFAVQIKLFELIK